MDNQKQKSTFVRADAFFKSAKPVDIDRGLKEQMRQDRQRSILDPVMLREQEDWNFLADKIVGAEGR